MFCEKCGQELPSDSLFCNKCGNKIKLESNIDEDIGLQNSEVLIFDNVEGSNPIEVEDSLKNKSKKPPQVMIVSIILIIFVFGMIWYSSHSNTRLSEARILHLSEEYYDAFKKVDGLLYFGDKKKEVEKIKLKGSLGSNYQFYKNEINLQYDFLTIDYERAVNLLFMGLDFIDIKEGAEKKDWENDIINDLKEKHYLELKNKFDLPKTTVDNIRNLDSDKKEGEITLIANKVKEKEEQTSFNHKNPIEFKNLEWDSNSSYTIATGQVYNRGDRTVRFVTIKVSFKDKNGNVIDTDSTYAVGSEGLAPGESTKWRGSVKKDKNIDNYSVSVIDFRY